MLQDYSCAEKIVRPSMTFVYLSTGILDSVFESQVLPVLRKMNRKDCRVVHISSEPFLSTRSEEWKERAALVGKEPFETVYVRKLPELNRVTLKFDAYRVYRVLSRHIQGPVVVHARGHMNAWKACIYNRCWAVFADLRGAIWDEKARTEPAAFQSLRCRPTTDFFLEIEEDVVRKADKTTCVSRAFKEHLQSRNPFSDIAVIPTFVDDAGFRFDPGARRETRHRLSVGNRPVFVFSAGSARWQMTSDLIKWCAGISNLLPESFFLILSLIPHKVQALAAKWLRSGCFIVKKVSYTEVGRYLSASDIGLLFRERLWTNRVAAPTKFSEYACSGLPVCITRGIGDTEEYVKTVGSGVIIDSVKEGPDISGLRRLLNVDREDSSRRGVKEYSRTRWIDVLEREYSLLAARKPALRT